MASFGHRGKFLGATALAAALCVWGPSTWAALPPATEFGAFTALDTLPPSPLVRRVQEALQGLGQFRGAVNGRLDDETAAAIRAYQRRAGLEEDGRASEELLQHIEFTGRAIELGARLEAARTDQMRAAEQALLAQPETRALMARRPVDERADITRDPSACFAAPTRACLLIEASESAKAIFDARFRDWVLGEIVVALARAGMRDEAFAAAARITDPRLIIAALRDIATARAEAGATDQALAVAAVIPDLAARGKAFAAIAAAQARSGGAVVAVAEIAAVARQLPQPGLAVTYLAESVVALARLGAADAAGDLIELARTLAPAADDPDAAWSHVAVALAASGDTSQAAQLLGRLTAEANRRPVLAALATEAARRDAVGEAREHAARIGEVRYRVGVLADVARVIGALNGPAAAAGVLTEALVQARELDERPSFARSHALRAVVLSMAQLGMTAPALEVADGIPDARLRAEALWAVGAALAAKGDPIGAFAARERAIASTAAVPSALDRTWILCGAAVVSASAADLAGAERAFARALDEARAITDPWARAQAITRVANTLGVMP